MKGFVLIFLIITLSATPLRDSGFHKYLVVWNVGQGQFVTAIEEDECLHFDVGGEFFPFRKLSSLCRDRQNKIFLSHWDWDHIGGLAKWPKVFTNSCIAVAPIGPTSDHKKNILDRFTPCAPNAISVAETKTWTPQVSKDTNSESHVTVFKDFLIPGDSPKTQERLWEHIPWIHQTRVLILGHHGSRTSTSPDLLNELPHLHTAVASARWARYKHPHAATVALLRKRRIALLKTEDWGSIWFEE